MKLSVINGSPRGVKSNSKVITDWILSSLDESIQTSEFYAVKTKTHSQAVESISNDSVVLMVFPLYTDAMPAILKLFFEELESIRDKTKNVRAYFVVQSGFLGANHCRYVERYLVHLSKYMGFEYMGTAIKPSGEGLRSMPDFMIRKTRRLFNVLGSDIQAGKKFDEQTLGRLANFERPGALLKFMMKNKRMSEMFMKGMLKQNGVYENRNDQPYIEVEE